MRHARLFQRHCSQAIIPVAPIVPMGRRAHLVGAVRSVVSRVVVACRRLWKKRLLRTTTALCHASSFVVVDYRLAQHNTVYVVQNKGGFLWLIGAVIRDSAWGNLRSPFAIPRRGAFESQPTSALTLWWPPLHRTTNVVAKFGRL